MRIARQLFFVLVILLATAGGRVFEVASEVAVTSTVDVTASFNYVAPACTTNCGGGDYSGGGGLPIFDSTPPQLFNLRIIKLTLTEAWVYWETDEPATGVVQYGKTDAYDKGAVLGEVYVRVHTVKLLNLEPGTEYHFRVRSADSFGNEAVSLDQVFTTLQVPDNVPAKIFFLRFENIGERSAEMVWQTDEPSRADIILFSARGKINLREEYFNLDHRFPLLNLWPNTTYTVELSVYDQAGNLAETGGNFKTLKDITPPANPANFRAVPANSAVYLYWKNPVDIDFDQVILVVRSDRFPKNIFDGEKIFSGREAQFAHLGLKNGEIYYYGLFALDDMGNASSGSLARATPQESLGPPPTGVATTTCPQPLPTIPAAPPFDLPAVTVSPEIRLTPADFSVWDGTGKILLIRGPDGEVTLSTGLGWRVTLPQGKIIAEDLDDFIGAYDGSAYRFYRQGENYILALPPIFSLQPELSFTAWIKYRGGKNDVVSFAVKIKEPGRVYEVGRDNKELLWLLSAQVWLLDKEKKSWPAGQFGQFNPVSTDANGRYIFTVPNNEYYLKVEKAGFRPYFSQKFTVKNNLVARDVRLFRWSLTPYERYEMMRDRTLDFVMANKLLLSLLLFLLLLLLWLLSKRRKKKDKKITNNQDTRYKQ